MNASRNSISMEGIGSQMTLNSLFFDSFDLNNQNQNLDGYTVLPTLRGTPISGNVDFARDQEEFQEQFPISGPALATIVASSRNGLQENLTSLAISEPSMYPSEVLRSYVSNNDLSHGLNSSFASSVNYSCDEVFGNVNAKEEVNRLSAPIRTGFQNYSSIGDMEPNSWISSNSVNVNTDNLYSSSKFSNELSLSLATSQPSGINGSHIADQCSEISCSGVTRHCFKETRLGSEQTSSSCKELSLSCGSYRAGQFSHVISGSRYLQLIQEILAQIASYSLENLDQMNFSSIGIKVGTNMLFSSSYPVEGGMYPMGPDESPNVNDRFEVQVDPALQKRALEAKKTQLLTLLQLVDDRYNRCLDEIHTVVSAFHAATELDPQMHTRFALQTISFMYKNLRERISNQILAMGAHFDFTGARGTEVSLETSYLQKQWSLQQLKKREHQLWRPQRGLPERSVSVLRAWMFQNFLHPYPKDAEKHLLAVKSGLTRSQVSNWFINARVRLWKPMIEEMYAEMNRRKGRQGDEGSNSNQRNHISISNLRFNVN
ncbi:homeobox protein ATH1 isoform X2 [Jatropha curcas]|uniref:homeobox protein ATH1 isoform X2 n=1 Tax=Jatropha curcas TaxID=180498 RepID=UPI0018952322|nr:homeobox protein ATH1 isoform X2 [Jatropha curcas]